MSRVDRASRVISASPATVFDAMIEPDAVVAWLPPEGMRGRLEHFDPRPGGGFRMVLTYLDPAGSPGKSSADEDVVEVEFAELVPGARVVQRAVFEAEDPDYAGTMTMTWELTPVGRGTDVVVSAVGVPAGIDQAAHEEGIASSLANLAAHVEQPGQVEPPGHVERR
jgi:uncharacterized protein YndB with AHSA1/START domain